MASSSRVVALLPVGCAIFFSLPFLAFGVASTYFTYAHRGRSWDEVGVLTLGATIFGSIGLMIMSAAVSVARRIPDRLTAEIPADAPWQMRSDWAAGKVRETTASSAAAWLLAALLLAYWLVATWPLLARLPEILRGESSSWKWAALVFPLIDVGLVLLLIFSFLVARKFGASVLHLTSVPGKVGGELSAAVHIPRQLRPESGFRLKLSCTEQYDCNGKFKQHIAWADERLVLRPVRSNSDSETIVPVRFAVPYDCPETSRPGARYETDWQLEVSARLRGADYRTQFSVPMFKTPESRPDFKPTVDEDTENSAAANADLLLRDAGILKESLPGGRVRLTFAAARHWGLAILATVLYLPLVGLIGLMIHFGAPILFPIAFGVVALMAGKHLLSLWFYRSVVEASSEGLTIRGGLFGIGQEQFIAAEQIDDFGDDDPSSWMYLHVVLRNEEYVTFARGITSVLVQRAVYDELEAALKRSGRSV
jgi:hypothetical protein